MKPICGFWLVVILWSFELVARIVLILTKGAAPWGTLIFYLSALLYLALEVAALFIAFSRRISTRKRAALLLIGSSMLIAFGIGLFTTLTPWWWERWPGLDGVLMDIGMVLESARIFGAIVLGWTATIGMTKHLAVLLVAGARISQITMDLVAGTQFALMLVLAVTLVMLFASYRLLPWAASRWAASD